jgi:hypothetical protein
MFLSKIKLDRSQEKKNECRTLAKLNSTVEHVFSRVASFIALAKTPGPQK